MANTEEPAVGSTGAALAAEPTAPPKAPAKAAKATKSASARASGVSTPAGSDDPDRDELDQDDEVGDPDRLAELEAENEAMRAKLAALGQPVDDPRKPKEPSFGISEGTREELERTGKATSPFTGRKVTKADLK